MARNLNNVWSFDGTTCDQDIHNPQTNVLEVESLIKNIDLLKSSAMDGLPTKVLKEAFVVISHQLTYMFNKSLEKGIVPEKWKLSTVIPIPKGNDQSNVTNLRPISLLPLPGKMLERIVHSHISNHLDTNNMLSDLQGGYRKNFSTIQTISDFTDEIAKNRNVGRITGAIFIDLKKAYDTVNHDILLMKLSKYGVIGQTLYWVKNYLSNRTQRTLANNVLSDIASVKCGIPQGSVLGPLLFLIYINDASNTCTECRIRLYADDTVIYKTGNHDDTDTISGTLQNGLENFNSWCKKNKLTINVSKTKCMWFGPTLLTKKELNLSLNNVLDHKVPTYKYLGIILDSTLNFEAFIKNQLKSVSYRTYQLTKMANYLPKDALLRIYKSDILPIIDYGDIIYTNANNFLLTKLQRAQNRCIKICLKVNRRTATDVIHARVRLPKLSDRRLAHQKILAFKRLKQSRYLDQRYLSTRLRDGPVLKVDMLHSEIYRKSVEYSTGVLWNALDVGVRNIDSLHTFKMLVKSELYNTIYQSSKSRKLIIFLNAFSKFWQDTFQQACYTSCSPIII